MEDWKIILEKLGDELFSFPVLRNEDGLDIADCLHDLAMGGTLRDGPDVPGCWEKTADNSVLFEKIKSGTLTVDDIYSLEFYLEHTVGRFGDVKVIIFQGCKKMINDITKEKVFEEYGSTPDNEHFKRFTWFGFSVYKMGAYKMLVYGGGVDSTNYTGEVCSFLPNVN